MFPRKWWPSGLTKVLLYDLKSMVLLESVLSVAVSVKSLLSLH